MLDDKPIEKFDVEAVNSAKIRQPLYQSRKKIHPKRASGDYRRFKWFVMLITLGIYYLTPWIRWDRGPNAPDQAVLLDFPHRRFYFFFIEIWPQEFIFIAGILVMGGVGLFLLTSVVGRAWCGYTCWQTVWVDLFLVVERWVEGDRNARIKLDATPWTFDKISKRVLKHVIWLLIAVATGGAWIFYFADAPTLFMNFMTFQAPPVAYITVAVLTATTYTFGGIMREQVCTYMCPWPRIQSAMLDEESLTVTYNDWRGEPRQLGKRKTPAKDGIQPGDCVDCNACVAVCPMGIDIRHGQQLECITCALCIDACDAVMDKLGKPRGLISYATLDDYQKNLMIAKGGDMKAKINPANVYKPDGKLVDNLRHYSFKHFLRPRTIMYFTVWSLIGLGILYGLLSRDRLEVNVLHDRNPQFVTLSDGSIRNGYTVKILNMIPEPRTIRLELEGLEGGLMSANGYEDQPAGRKLDIPVDPDKTLPLKVYITMPAPSVSSATTDFKFIVTDLSGTERDFYDADFAAPKK